MVVLVLEYLSTLMHSHFLMRITTMKLCEADAVEVHDNIPHTVFHVYYGW